MSFFFGGQQARAAPVNPATEIGRLLNNHSTHWCNLEQEIEATKKKQEAAQAAYLEAVEQVAAAKEAVVKAEEELASTSAHLTQCAYDVEAKQQTNRILMDQVEQLRAEVASINGTADGARQGFMQECVKLQKELQELQRQWPGCFFTTAHPGNAQ